MSAMFAVTLAFLQRVYDEDVTQEETTSEDKAPEQSVSVN